MNFFASVQVELEISNKTPLNTSVAIDRGVSHFGSCSDGKFLEIPIDKIKHLERKIARSQKILAKKLKGYNNWKKSLKKVGGGASVGVLEKTKTRRASLKQKPMKSENSSGIFVL